MLLLSTRLLSEIGMHAARRYPEECCGILLGKSLPGDGGDVVVERVLAANNTSAERRGERFLIAPEVVLAAHREARAGTMEIVGYYHSHPDHPAVPSALDREQAWPGMRSVIAAVERGEVTATRSWRLEGAGSAFVEEAIEDPTTPGG